MLRIFLADYIPYSKLVGCMTYTGTNWVEHGSLFNS